MRKLFLVLGPESAGNHVVTMLLVKMGCFGTFKNGALQVLDPLVKGEATDDEIKNIISHDLLVLRRSVPYGLEWPSPSSIKDKFKQYNYEMVTIVVFRTWAANAMSNYYHRATTIEESLDNLIKEWVYIGERLSEMKPFYFFDTSFLIKDPESAILELEIFTKLKWPNDIDITKEIKDPDTKRFKAIKEYGFKSIDRGLLQL